MFEPGQKVMVVKSNFDKKTGPRVGSIGFLSDFNINFHSLRFNRIVWYQFGNQKTYRMEASPFGMILPNSGSRFRIKLRDLSCRRGGTVVPIFERKKVEDMEELEFNCWLYSIMRLYRGYQPSDKIRNKMSFAGIDFNPRVFSQHKFRIENRVKLANLAREQKLIAFKSSKTDTENCLTQASHRIDRLVREGYRAEKMVERIIIKRGLRYEYFYELFTRIVYLNVVGQMAFKNISANSHPYGNILMMMWQEWQKLHENAG